MNPEVLKPITMKRDDKIAAWSSYWSEGNATSLPNLFPDNYGGAISRFWDRTFAILKEGSRMLDICTGNGALAILARDHADRRNIHCDIEAIDVARIHFEQPAKSREALNTITFHSGAAVEATHFPPEWFDLIVGQFALEYCRAEDAIKELSRITRPDGVVVMMMHHADSITVEQTRRSLATANLLLKNPAIFFRLRKYAEEYARQNGRETPKLTRRRRQFLESFNTANQLLPRFPNDRFLRLTLANIKALYEQVHNHPAVGAEIRKFEEAVYHHVTRMTDHRDAAVNVGRKDELESLFLRYGFPSVQSEPFHLEGELLSWTLTVSKSLHS